MSKGNKVPGGSLGSLLEKLSRSVSAKTEDQHMVTEEELVQDNKSKNLHSAKGAFSVKSARSFI